MSSRESPLPTVGLDIGGTKVLGVLLDAGGEIVREQRRLSPHAGVDALVATAAGIVEELAQPGSPVGVGAAGLVNHDGHVLYSPNLPTVREAPLREALLEATGHPLIVDNDANVAARGEIAYGAAKGLQHALLVTLGTGIGGGMLLDGHLYRGAHGFGAEIGHITVERDGPLCACGERGHWEAIASGSALGRMARERAEGGGGANILAAAGGTVAAITGVHVEEAAHAGDPDAIALLAEYADNVSIGLAALANVLDPEVIVIAGGLVELGPLLFDPLQASFLRHIEGAAYRPNIPIVPAELGERVGAVGAAVLAARVADVSVRVGLTLPSFVEDPEIPIAVAREAEAAGLDGVFVFDHLWRGDPPNRRPALECFALLGAVAAETARIQVGTLVARATLRPPATLANCFLTAERVSSGRLIAGIGAGDSQSRAENEAFGLEFGTMADRILALHDAVRAAGSGDYPVWVGGRVAQVREIVTVADGWNGWGGTPEKFSADVELVREVAPDATITWGGLVLTGADDAEAGAKAATRAVADDVLVGGPARIAEQLREFESRGADWLILGPIDSTDPRNATALGEARRLLQ